MKLNRRALCRLAAGFTLSGFLPRRRAVARTPSGLHTGGRVVIVRRPSSVHASGGSIDNEAVYRMLGDGLCALTGDESAVAACRRFFALRETVGIKVNALGGRRICTHPELAYAFAKHLAASGISSADIIIWDRLTSELRRAGYRVNKTGSGPLCFGTDNEYEHTPEISGSIGSCFSRILTRRCDAVISMPVMKDHDLSGVSVNLKNFYGAIHNPNKYHDNLCDPFIADLNAHRHIRNKLRLVITDALQVQYHGGPAFKPQWSWGYGGILLSADPVAADTVAADIIDQKRQAEGLCTLREDSRPPVHITTAAHRGLGTGSLDNIQKIELNG